MPNRPVSVIMPCWNVAKWVEESVRSVLAAAPLRAEVIVVDDGSTDETDVILRRLAAEDGRIRVVTQANRGVSAARNRGLDAARGEYVFFVDPDDTVAPAFFSAMLAAMVRTQADYCVCGYTDSPLKADYHFESAEAIRTGYLKRVFGYSYDDIRAWYRGTPLFSTREMAFVWRAVFRRDIIERFHIRFDEAIALNEDSLFNVEYLLRANRMTSVNRCLYHARARAEGAMRRLGRDAAFVCRNRLQVLRKRNALDVASGGVLTPLYAGSCVLGALDLLALTIRGRVPLRVGWGALRRYLHDETVRRAFDGFPLSCRKPLVSLAVWLLRVARRATAQRESFLV